MAPNTHTQKALVVHPAPLPLEERLKVEQVPFPGAISPTQVLIKICSVGICGTDIHIWADGHMGPYVLKDPMISGHEAAGIVVEVGVRVDHLAVGDRVTIEPGVPCHKCRYCMKGRYNLCPDTLLCSLPPWDGILREYFIWEADFVLKIPDHISMDVAAIMEPFAICVHAINRAGVMLGSKILITGAGPMGLLCMLTAMAKGATKAVITDLSDVRLKLAKSIGADTVINIRGKSDEEMDKLILDAFDGEGPDITIECSGAEPAIRLGMRVTDSGGNLVCVGMGRPLVTVPLTSACCCREVNIIGVFRNDSSCFPSAMELLRSGKVDPTPIISHRFPIEESLEAFQSAKNGDAVKVVIRVAEDEFKGVTHPKR